VVFGRVGPLPSRGSVHAALELSRPAEVRADVFDVRGRLVRAVVLGVVPAGRQRIRWDGRLDDGTRASSGVYWMRLRAEGLERTTKVVLTR
jgi:flagellar hook assembly protein FlgD